LAISVNIKTQIACHNFFFKFNCLALEAIESLIYFGSDSWNLKILRIAAFWITN